MMRNVGRIEWDDPLDYLPAFITIAFIPFTFSTTDGALRNSLHRSLKRTVLFRPGFRLSPEFTNQARALKMSAIVIRDERFRQFIEAERARPVQRKLFTGEPESVSVDVSEILPEDETILDDGISV